MSKFIPTQGVSIVVCCHNSVKRLYDTISHLKKQQLISPIPWEIIIVDNASTDGTAKAAIDIWDGHLDIPFRVVLEPMLGLSNARIRGFEEARYEFVSFVDDDNWVASDWVEKVPSDYEWSSRCGSVRRSQYWSF